MHGDECDGSRTKYNTEMRIAIRYFALVCRGHEREGERERGEGGGGARDGERMRGGVWGWCETINGSKYGHIYVFPALFAPKMLTQCHRQPRMRQIK